MSNMVPLGVTRFYSVTPSGTRIIIGSSRGIISVFSTPRVSSDYFIMSNMVPFGVTRFHSVTLVVLESLLVHLEV